MKPRLAVLAASLVLIVGSVSSGTSHAQCTTCGDAPLTAYEVGRYYPVSEADNASALFINPAGLGQPRKFNLYLDAAAADDGLDELSLAAQLGGLGIGYHQRDFQSATGNQDTNAFLLGWGVGPRHLRLGLQGTWTHAAGHDITAASLWLGLQSRISRRLSAGIAAKNVNHPSFFGQRAAAQFQYGLSVRPFPAAEQFTLSGQVTHTENDGPTDLAFTAAYESPAGWGLRALLEFPEEGDAQFGLAATAFFSNSRATLAGRSVDGSNSRAHLSALYHGETRREAIVMSQEVATLRMGGDYADERDGFVLWGGGSQGTLDLIRRIDDAAQDKDVRALAVRMGQLSGGFIGPITAQHDELRAAFLRFRQSGKPIVAYLESVNNQAAAVYVASGADWIVMPPLAGIQGLGVSVHITRMKRTFEKFGIAWDADTSGTYKSTFHGHYTDTTSVEQRAAIESLINDAFMRLMNGLMDSRHITESDMLSLGTGRVIFPDECVSTGLVDQLGWWDDALMAADRLSGGEGDAVPPKQDLPDRTEYQTRWAPPPAVAVIPVSGSIRSGSSGQSILGGGRTMGSETVIRQLKAAAGHPRVKAVVFRVDTGGGSALASEEIRQEIKKLKQRGMPFYVSMGGAAASGGYWIAMDADTIFADASTITGSIGVVASFPIFEGLYEKLDMTSETFKRGEYTDMFSMNRPMTAEEREMLNASLNFIYEEFLTGVSEGRNLPLETVRELAGGRVYFGTQAQQLGLVDRIGTLHDAVETAARSAGVDQDFEVLTVGYSGSSLFKQAMGAVGLGSFYRALIRGDSTNMP